MEDKFEIYVRQGSEHNMLNLYVPSHMREAFTKALSGGTFQVMPESINFEISVLPEWLSDESQQESAKRSSEPMHVRVPISAINIQFGE